MAGAPGAAQAEILTDSFVFSGRGYGHGVGMSQWGAWAAAKDSKNFRWIVGFYFPGALLGPLYTPDPELTVKLSSKPWEDIANLTQTFTRAEIRGTVGSAPVVVVKRIGEAQTTEQVAVGANIALLNQSGKVAVQTPAHGPQGGYDSVEVRPGAGGRVTVRFTVGGTVLTEREYWGALKGESAGASGLTVFNLVALERYLRSIAEVDYDWAQPEQPAYAPEAVKAQAVAARSYAIANRYPYLNDNQYDQVYRGYTFETSYPGIAKAAEETADLVLRHEGKVITAFFSSSSGGYTTTWSGTEPYLVAKPDPYSLQAPKEAPGPGYPWSFTLSAAELSGLVNDGMRDVAGRPVAVGTLWKAEVVSRDTSSPESHAQEIRLTGDKGTATVRASTLRGRLGYGKMRSTLILAIRNPGFTDVPLQHAYHDDIMRIARLGLVGGFSDATFRPEGPVSRWQFAKMAVGLHNYLFPTKQIPVVDVTQAPFADVSLRAGYLGDESDWVAAAKAAGLVRGLTADAFGPYASVRRDQMATMVVRTMGWADEAAALPPGTLGFSDVEPSSPHSAPATYLKSLGILRGYVAPTGTGMELRAGEPTKRMHVAVILGRVLDHQ